jgi:hypothetical protein
MLGKTLFSCERPIPPSTGPPGRHFRGKDHGPRTHFNLDPNFILYHLFASVVNGKLALGLKLF